jgi:ribosomal protein L11
MTATTRLLLEAAHGTTDPAVLTEAANSHAGSVEPDDIRRIAEMKVPDYSQKLGEPISPDRAVKIVRQAAQAMGISVTDRP